MYQFSNAVTSILVLIRGWFNEVNFNIAEMQEKMMKNFQDLYNDVQNLTSQVKTLQDSQQAASQAVSDEIARVEQVIADLRNGAATPEQIDAAATALEASIASLGTVAANLDQTKAAADATEPPTPPTTPTA